MDAIRFDSPVFWIAVICVVVVGLVLAKVDELRRREAAFAAERKRSRQATDPEVRRAGGLARTGGQSGSGSSGKRSSATPGSAQMAELPTETHGRHSKSCEAPSAMN